jgi:hypothetical protein
MRMRRLINVIKGVIEAHVIQFWHRILEKDLRQRVQDMVFTQRTQPMLALVF